MLTPPDIEFETNATFWEKFHLVRQSEGMTRASALGTVLLTTVQSDYAESLGVELGSEFRVAHDYCLASHPTVCILGDRPLQITLVRAWESLRWWGKSKLLLGLLWSCLKKTDPQELREWMQKILMEGESDVLTESIAELRQHFPSLERVILQERDAYMACKLYQCCRILPRRQNHTVVAIVGAGHLPGICQWLTNSTESRTPEEILSSLVETKKWKGEMVQSLTTDVTQLSMRHV
jgi:pheromone shutdown protein TraB